MTLRLAGTQEIVLSEETSSIAIELPDDAEILSVEADEIVVFDAEEPQSGVAGRAG